MSVLLDLLGAGPAGLSAGLLMTLFEYPFWKKWGLEAVAEWQVNTVMVPVLIRKFTRRRAGALMAVIMYLFHATVLGILFLVLLIVSQTPDLFPATVAYGVGYSIVPLDCLSLSDERSLRISRRHPNDIEGTSGQPLAQIVYGASLGFLLSPFV